MIIRNIACLDEPTPWIHKYTHEEKRKKEEKKKVFGWFGHYGRNPCIEA